VAYCGTCGTALVEGERFCRSCGREVGQAPIPAAAQPMAPAGTAPGMAPVGVVPAGGVVFVPAVQRRSGTGLNIVLGIVAAILLVIFVLCLWAAKEAQHNLDMWTGPSQGAPNPGAFGGIAVVTILLFVVAIVVLIVRLLMSDRRRSAGM
jgi:hypothetical protein